MELLADPEFLIASIRCTCGSFRFHILLSLPEGFLYPPKAESGARHVRLQRNITKLAVALVTICCMSYLSSL